MAQANGDMMSTARAGRVVEAIRQQVRRGGLATDGYLPAERTLAQSFGVARGTLRTALAHLEQEGLLVAEGHRRRVTSRMHVDQTLMGNTIGLLTLPPQPPSIQSTRQTLGWENVVEFGVIQAAEEAQMNVLRLHGEALQQDRLQFLLNHPLRSVIVAGMAERYPHLQDVVRTLAQARVPVVVYGDDPWAQRFDRVVSDHAEGAYQLTRYLARHGCRRILRVWAATPHDPYWIEGRNAGYRRAVDELGLESLEPLRPMYLPESSGQAKDFEGRVMLIYGYLMEYRNQGGHFDAIMAGSDRQAYPLIGACRKLGLQPGHDVRIVGYDNFWQDCEERQWESAIPAATVDKNNLEIGRQLCALALQPPAGDGAASVRRIVTPRLVVNEATGQPEPTPHP